CTQHLCVSKARDGGFEKQSGIAIEGAEVLFGIPNVANACTYLIRLIYALDLSYLKKLKYTFEDVNKKLALLSPQSQGQLIDLKVLQTLLKV
ncbi:hypothetical protein C0J45_24298, partial [Silurus meridionalis]